MSLDLRAIGRPAMPSSPRINPPPSPPPAASTSRRKSLGLTLEELVQVVGATADPILAAELARRTASPAPPEPAPQALPTAELLAQLPGRHDLIAAATRRLAEETGDFKPASWSFFRKAVESVATRAVPPEILMDCRRQATGPKAKDPGKVFVVSWKREVRMRC